MADLKFNTSFITKSGNTVYRTDGILVEDKGRIRSAQVVDIWDNLSAFYVTANVSLGDPNTVLPKGVTHRYDGAGFYHLSERGNPGINQDARFFVLPQEGEVAAIALHAHMNGIWEDIHAYWIKNAEPGQPTYPTGRPQPEREPKEFHPADTDQSGGISKAEAKAYNKSHPDSPVSKTE